MLSNPALSKKSSPTRSNRRRAPSCAASVKTKRTWRRGDAETRKRKYPETWAHTDTEGRNYEHQSNSTHHRVAASPRLRVSGAARSFHAPSFIAVLRSF